MLSQQIGSTLRDARRGLAISQAELATRAGVTTRLVSEFERGVRPNVSLETALRILNEVGVVVQLGAPDGRSVRLVDPTRADAARDARAQARRMHWTGQQIRLTDEGKAPDAPTAKTLRLAAVQRVSVQAHAIARAPAASTPTPDARRQRESIAIAPTRRKNNVKRIPNRRKK